MTEELNNFNTDCKDLFMQNKIDDIITALEDKSDADVLELLHANYDVVNKYYTSEKFDLLFTYFKFVAYSCFFVEYATKRGILSAAEQAPMMEVFSTIFTMYQTRNKQ